MNLNVLALEICDRRDEKSPRQFSIENGELAVRNVDERAGQHQSVTPESQAACSDQNRRGLCQFNA